MKDGLLLAAKYALITNKLGYCGPNDAYKDFLKYPDHPELRSIVREHLERFEGLYPYLEHIAQKHGKDPFDHDVAEAYWIGNELLHSFVEDELKDLIMSLAERGLPKSFAKKKCDDLPKGMVPHHSFNVLYVGVGKITGSVPTNLENINKCLIRPGIIKNDNIVNIMELTEEGWKEKEIKCTSDGSFPLGTTVAVHWDHIVDKVDAETLSRYTNINLKTLELPFMTKVI